MDHIPAADRGEEFADAQGDGRAHPVIEIQPLDVKLRIVADLAPLADLQDIAHLDLCKQAPARIDVLAQEQAQVVGAEGRRAMAEGLVLQAQITTDIQAEVGKLQSLAQLIRGGRQGLGQRIRGRGRAGEGAQQAEDDQAVQTWHVFHGLGHPTRWPLSGVSRGRLGPRSARSGPRDPRTRACPAAQAYRCRVNR